jgi:signal peptidase I
MSKSKKNIIREYAESIGIAVIAALIIRALFIQAFRIPTGSMENTLLIGDFLLVNKFIYGARVPFTDYRLPKIKEPEQGDIVVFKYPRDPKLDYIKRCVAISGQTVEIRDKLLYVNNKRVLADTAYTHFLYDRIPGHVRDPEIFPPGKNWNRDNYGPFVVPEGHIFMMGDNRDNSLDSRYWGPLPLENVVGEALIIYWSWDFNIPMYKFFTKVRWRRILNLIN